jgi:type II secretory pathway component PulC
LKRVLQAVSVILGCLALLLVWRIVQVWRVSAPEFQEPAQVAATDPLPPSPPRNPAGAGAVDAIVQGNLFETERGVGEEATDASAHEEPLPPPTNVVLNGVFFQTTGRPMAIITDTSSGNRQLTLQEGDNVGDYQVGKITRDRVTLLGHGGQEFSLELAVSQGVAAGPQPARATPPVARTPPAAPPAQAAQTAAQRAAAARRQAQTHARPGQNRAEEAAAAPQQNEGTQARLEALRRLREAASK